MPGEKAGKASPPTCSSCPHPWFVPVSHPSGTHRTPDLGRVVDEDLPPKQLERLKEEAEKSLENTVFIGISPFK